MPFFGKLLKRGLSIGEKLEHRRVDPMQLQAGALRRLLKMAQQTVFGQYYDFKDILKAGNPVAAFQDKVPLLDYDAIYERWWHMTLNGVEDVAWPGKIKYFALSSGASGAPSKHIPVSDEMRRAMRHAALKMFFALTNFDVDPELYTRPMLMLGGSSDLQENGDYFMGDLSGINASQPPFWMRPYYKPGTEVARIRDWGERINEIARLAPQWDIGFIVGIPSWLQLLMERIIEYHRLDNIHQLWPNLQVCVHGGIAFEPLKKGFEKLLAHPLIYMDTYLASEGFIAYQDRPGTRGMRLLVRNGIFFEFIPFNSYNFDEEGRLHNHARALTLEQTREDVDYALVISTCSGAWRYLIGDTVRFTDKERWEIVITGRTRHFLSICGEHLSVDNMNQGIQYAEEKLDINIREFTVSPQVLEGSYLHKWYIGCEPMADSAALARLLDERLKEVNDDYRTERASLLHMEVEVLPISLFYQWQESKGKMGGQNKFPRVMKGRQFEEWEAFVRQTLKGSGRDIHISRSR